MRLSTSLLIVLLSINFDAATAVRSQFALPGYISDPESLTQATPQLVLTSLRAVSDARVKLTEQNGVFLIDVLGDPTPESYVFFGKGHWAYPSVLRFKRKQIFGAWATHISVLCGAKEKACIQLAKRLQARRSQVVNAAPAVLENEELKRLQRPLPDGIPPPGKHFWISEWGPVADMREYDWRDTAGQADTDQRCNVTSPRYALPPRYPMEEELNGISGHAVMIVTVDRTGRAIDARLERSSGNRNLDRAALSSASIMRFHVKGCDSPSSVSRARIPVAFIPSTSFPYMQLADFDASAFGF